MDSILTLNCGSSSVKFSIFPLAVSDDDALKQTPLAIGQIEGLGAEVQFKVKDGQGHPLAVNPSTVGLALHTHADAIQCLLDWLKGSGLPAEIRAVGHRVVHGGVHYAEPLLASPEVLETLATLNPLAPLHQPHNLRGIAAAQHAFPHAPQVLCFDTAFHRQHPFVNDTFALPRQYFDEGVRRYGFHGLSYEFITRKLRSLAPTLAEGRVVVAHLGNGASMCAIREGRSVASTMGFSALDGLPMGTRCGQLDPGVLLYLIDQKGMSAQALSRLLYSESGLKGLSGISHDMRALQHSDDVQARQAIDYFVFRIRRELGGLAAALEGLDAVVFCGGIGENAVQVRSQVLSGMQWLGIELDEEANRRNELIISAALSRVRVLRIETNEEAMIAAHVRSKIMCGAGNNP